MEKKKELIRWVKRGRQKKAIAQVVRKPMTPIEICEAATKISSNIRLCDVMQLLRGFEKKRLVYCLNPHRSTGKLYFPTLLGSQVVCQAFCMMVEEIPIKINWKKYSFVVRGKSRRMILTEFVKSGFSESKGISIPEIRSRLKGHYPVGTNVIVRVVNELEKVALLKCVGTKRNGKSRLYSITEEGKEIVTQLTK